MQVIGHGDDDPRRASFSLTANPIADIELVADPAKNFVLIMKDGKIYKNTLPH